MEVGLVTFLLLRCSGKRLVSSNSVNLSYLNSASLVHGFFQVDGGQRVSGWILDPDDNIRIENKPLEPRIASLIHLSNLSFMHVTSMLGGVEILRLKKILYSFAKTLFVIFVISLFQKNNATSFKSICYFSQYYCDLFS